MKRRFDRIVENIFIPADEVEVKERYREWFEKLPAEFKIAVDIESFSRFSRYGVKYYRVTSELFGDDRWVLVSDISKILPDDTKYSDNEYEFLQGNLKEWMVKKENFLKYTKEDI